MAVKSQTVITAGSTMSFPLLAKWRTSGLVVLFTSRKEGTAVAGSALSLLGDFSDSWESCTNTEKWEILPKGSQVILTQED